MSADIPSVERDLLLNYLQSNHIESAFKQARKLTQQYPKDVFGWKVLGTLFVHQGDSQTAQLVLESAHRIAPDDAEILNNLGQVYQNLKKFEQALVVYRQAAKLCPNLAEIWYNQGLVLQKLGDWDNAFKSYKKAIQIRPNYAKAYNNLGDLLNRLGYLEEALSTYEKLLAIYPDDPATLNNLGSILRTLSRLNEALTALNKALTIEPKFAGALVNRGNIFMEQGCLEAAITDYEQALSIQPDLIIAKQNRAMCLNYFSDYSSNWILSEHRELGQFLESKIQQLEPDNKHDKNPDRRLRLGFVSGDFRQHSVAFFLLPILENLDRQAFEIYGYSTCPSKDDWTQKFQSLATVWVESTVMEPNELADRIRADAIDLLFDLAGYTAGNILAVFAAKPAPIQITWIGYPNTTGLKTIDYRLVDNITDPPSVLDNEYTEKLVRLPKSFLCYRPQISPETPSVSPLPFLQKKHITFGSFNNLAKITSATLDLWVAILQSVPHSHLHLKSGFIAEISVWERLVDYFVKNNIAKERLEIQSRLPSYNEHLTSYKHIDITLDTFPYNGTTTTCESLFMGVPVITLAGDRHVARVGASLLTQIGLPEFIANSTEDYVRIAVNLAAHPTYLSQLRSDMRNRLERSPLRDEVSFTRTFEVTLRQMWCHWCDDKPSQIFELNLQEQSKSSTLLNSKKLKARKNKITELRSLPKKLQQKFIETEKQKAFSFFEAGDYNQAIKQAYKIIESCPEDGASWKLLGVSLAKNTCYQEALSPLLEAIHFNAEADSLNALGFSLSQLGRLKEAETCYKRALEIDPKFAQAYSNLGVLYSEQGNLDLALEQTEKALAIDPEYADAYLNRGCIFGEKGLLKESENNYKRALELNPNSAIVHNNVGKFQMVTGDFYAAEKSYRRAIEIQPDLSQSFNNMLFCLNYRDDLSVQQLFSEHCRFESTLASHIARLTPLSPNLKNTDRRLKLGFVSGDFKFHSVAFFLFPILENLDRQKFEIFCYSLSNRQDEATVFFRKLADNWLDCQSLPPVVLAERIRADHIDLLFDLNGHTSPNALLTFAARPAPIQITWIGYPNTTGLSSIDYRLVDELTDPLFETDRYHTERLIRLPTGFLCYRPWSTAFELPVATLPYLQNGYITFGSFNNFCKITPTTLDLWIKVLQAVPNSKLLLKSHTSAEVDIWNRLVQQCEIAGIAAERLSFLSRTSYYTDHLEQYKDMDIALDTYPYNGTTTTCEALFMGVPVITLAGDRHVSRVGTSLMTRVGLKEFIAHSPEEYINIAKHWATNVALLADLRTSLRERLERSSLRDEVGFTRTLENTLHKMWQLWCAGKSPEVFSVESTIDIKNINKKHE